MLGEVGTRGVVRNLFRGGGTILLGTLVLLLLLLLKDNPSLDEVGVGAPLRPNVSKNSISTTPVGDLLLGYRE